MNYLNPALEAGGRLDLRLSWATLTGQSPQPGHLGRLGPITPGQARHLADLAAMDPGTRWRIVLTDPAGRAVAITGLPRQASRQTQASHQTQACLIKRVTITIRLDRLAEAQPYGQPSVLRRLLIAAQTLAQNATEQTSRDAQSRDVCAHADATANYRPTTRLREFVTVRDQTCRFPTCRQPAWRCDLDHSVPFDQGGRTCSCNLGGLCRFHHQIKGQARWRLDQGLPGIFTWTTPNGRHYTIEPDSHVA